MILIQCTKSKRDETAKAKDLYDTSPLFRKSKRYAQLKNQEWHILSAKHGMVAPSVELDPYDEFGLSVEQSETIARRVDKRYPDTVELLAGKQYADPLRPELEKHNIAVTEPMGDRGIGERMAWLDEQIKTLENQTLTDATG